MRLLLRANAHRRTDDGGVEIAASPDTPGRERWQWHIHLHDLATAHGAADVEGHLVGSNGVERLLTVSTDLRTTQAELQVHDVEAPLVIQRDANELLVLLVHRGAAVLEGRHVLSELDALVLEGDDPLQISVDGNNTTAGLTVVRLTTAADRPLAWVP